MKNRLPAMRIFDALAKRIALTGKPPIENDTERMKIQRFIEQNGAACSEQQSRLEFAIMCAPGVGLCVHSSYVDWEFKIGYYEKIEVDYLWRINSNSSWSLLTKQGQNLTKTHSATFLKNTLNKSVLTPRLQRLLKR